MNAGGMAVGIVFLLVGIAFVGVGIATYATCNGTSGTTTITGPSGESTSYPSGCGALLIVVAFGVLFALAGFMAALRAARSTQYRNPLGYLAPPPPIFGAPGTPLPSAPSLPKVRCSYCGTLLDPGPLRCPSCGARL